MTALVFDLETVPLTAAMNVPYPEDERPVPGNYKDTEKIAAWREKDRVKWAGERAKECSLSPRLGRIVAAGCTPVDSDLGEVFVAKLECEEVTLLLELWDRIAAHNGRIVTFNGLGFDIPFFLFRSMVHGIGPKVSVRTLRDWTRRYSYGPHYDVRAILTQWDYRTAGRLSEWAECLGCGSEDSSTGSDVYELYLAGDFDTIKNHCLADITSTKSLYQAVSAMYGAVAA